MIAALMGHQNVVQAFIKSGADVNSFEYGYYHLGKATALMHAAFHGHSECLDILLQAGANVNGLPGVTEHPFKQVTQYIPNTFNGVLARVGIHVDYTPAKNDIPLIISARLADYKAMSLLIQAGADVNATDRFSRTPLFEVCHHNNIFGWIKIDYKIKCLKLLLRAGAHVNRSDCERRNVLSTYILESYMVSKADILLLHAAGEILEKINYYETDDETDIPEHLLNENGILSLRHLSRQTIRKHLLGLSPVNLFIQIPKLNLPKSLECYLLYNMSYD